MPAHLALPAGKGKAPVAIVLHERYGYVKHQKDVAERFAREGYVGLAPNMFFKYPDQKAIAENRYHYDMTDPESVEYMAAALETLGKDVPRANMSRVAVMGVCQTGRHALVTAAELPIHAVLIWYGAVSAKNFQVNHMYPRPLEDLIKKVAGPIHGVFGEACHFRKKEADACWASQIAFLKEAFSPDRDPTRLIQRFKSDIGVDYDFSKNYNH